MSPRASHTPSTLSVAEVLPVDVPAPQSRTRTRHATTVLVTEGVVYLVLEDDEQVLTPGDAVTVPAGTTHRFFNAGDEDAHVAITYERAPAEGRAPALTASGCA